MSDDNGNHAPETLPDRVTAAAADAAPDLKQLVEADRQRRVRECKVGMEALLKQFGCGFRSTVVLVPGPPCQIIPQVEIVAVE